MEPWANCARCARTGPDHEGISGHSTASWDRTSPPALRLLHTPTASQCPDFVSVQGHVSSTLPGGAGQAPGAGAEGRKLLTGFPGLPAILPSLRSCHAPFPRALSIFLAAACLASPLRTKAQVQSDKRKMTAMLCSCLGVVHVTPVIRCQQLRCTNHRVPNERHL